MSYQFSVFVICTLQDSSDHNMRVPNHRESPGRCKHLPILNDVVCRKSSYLLKDNEGSSPQPAGGVGSCGSETIKECIKLQAGDKIDSIRLTLWTLTGLTSIGYMIKMLLRVHLIDRISRD